MLPYDKLQRGFANKQATHNVRFSWCFAVKRRRKLEFVDSYYSPCRPLGITPGRFYYCKAKFWAENLGTVNTYLYLFGTLFTPNRTFLVRFGGISGEFGRAMVRILARRSRAKIPMARPNEPDMPPKRIKKVRLGIHRTQIRM